MPDHRHAASDVIRDFTVHKNHIEKHKRNAVCAQLKFDANRIVSESGKKIDGYAIVYYRKATDEDGDPMIETAVTYYHTDPMDTYAMPYLAFEKLSRRQH